MWMDVNAKDKARQGTLERQMNTHHAADRAHLQQSVQILDLATRVYHPSMKQSHELVPERRKSLYYLSQTV